MLRDLDIYEAVLEDITDGILKVSLVSCPAIEANFLTFAEDKEPLKFAIVSEDQHILYSPLMACNRPIYRRDGDYEFYITYSKQTIQKMMQKLLEDGNQSKFNLQHMDGTDLKDGSISMVEMFQIDREHGIDPIEYKDMEDGSLMCKYKINDEELWQEIKRPDSEWKGLSLEGIFSCHKRPPKKNKLEKHNTMNKILETLKSLVCELETSEQKEDVETEVKMAEAEPQEVKEEPVEEPKAEDEPKGEGDMAEAEESISDKAIKDAEAEGEFEEGGKVEEFAAQDPKEEPQPAEQPQQEPVEDLQKTLEKNLTNQIQADIEELRTEINAIRETLAQVLSSPLARPIQTDFSADEEVETVEELKFNTGNKKFDKNLQSIYDAFHND